MDKLDIFEIQKDTKITTTIGQIRRIYSLGERDGMEIQSSNYDERIIMAIENRPTLIEGDIV